MPVPNYLPNFGVRITPVPVPNYFEDYIASLAAKQPDILLMHDGPNIPELGFRGSLRIREALLSLSKPLIVRGQTHWISALAMLPNRLQVLNVDARVIVLVADPR